jgi:hypothetical protein
MRPKTSSQLLGRSQENSKDGKSLKRRLLVQTALEEEQWNSRRLTAFLIGQDLGTLAAGGGFAAKVCALEVRRKKSSTAETVELSMFV